MIIRQRLFNELDKHYQILNNFHNNCYIFIFLLLWTYKHIWETKQELQFDSSNSLILDRANPRVRTLG
jgi:hypothetical protein